MPDNEQHEAEPQAFPREDGAENRGLSILDVCDSDSGMLEAIYSTLIGADGERFEELDIEPTWCNLLVVDSITIHEASETSSLRRQLIETAIALFCPSGLIVAEEESLALTIDDWRQLGFRRITDSRFVFRDQLRTNPYNKQTRQIVDEGTYVCPGCGEVIVVPVDLTQGAGQEYVEDCPVCCRANRIHVDIDDMGYATVWVEPELNDE